MKVDCDLRPLAKLLLLIPRRTLRVDPRNFLHSFTLHTGNSDLFGDWLCTRFYRSSVGCAAGGAPAGGSNGGGGNDDPWASSAPAGWGASVGSMEEPPF